MKIDRNRTAAFSGHRSFKMKNGSASLFASTESAADKLEIRLETAVRSLCKAGYDTFLCGMAEGFDLMAAEAVIKLMDDFPGIRLIAVIPFPGQADYLNDKTRSIYHTVLSAAQAQITICNDYSYDCFHRRNDFLAENSTALVCYYNGSKGGTAYTVKRALKQGSEVINVAQ